MLFDDDHLGGPKFGRSKDGRLEVARCSLFDLGRRRCHRDSKDVIVIGLVMRCIAKGGSGRKGGCEFGERRMVTNSARGSPKSRGGPQAGKKHAGDEKGSHWRIGRMERRKEVERERERERNRRAAERLRQQGKKARGVEFR